MILRVNTFLFFSSKHVQVSGCNELALSSLSHSHTLRCSSKFQSTLFSSSSCLPSNSSRASSSLLLWLKHTCHCNCKHYFSFSRPRVSRRQVKQAIFYQQLVRGNLFASLFIFVFVKYFSISHKACLLLIFSWIWEKKRCSLGHGFLHAVWCDAMWSRLMGWAVNTMTHKKQLLCI